MLAFAKLQTDGMQHLAKLGDAYGAEYARGVEAAALAQRRQAAA